MTPFDVPKPPSFSHPSEEMFARLLDFHGLEWRYEPRSFPLQWHPDGTVHEAFTPDFYLPEFDLYVEVTTMRQDLITRKNRKVRLLRSVYPHIKIQVFYQKDMRDLELHADSGSPGDPPIDHVLFSAEDVERRVGELADSISEDYAGKEVKLLGVLRGSVYFLTELSRRLRIPARVDFLAISRFAPDDPAPQRERIVQPPHDPIEGEHVLLVAGIVDLGLSARFLLRELAVRAPESIHICTLLDRSSRRLVPVDIRYSGFEIPDRFVVGCGLDYRQLYRNLPYIAVVKPLG